MNENLIVSKLHWLASIFNHNWMVIGLENLNSLRFELVTSWLGINLEVVASNISVNCSSFLSCDHANINITSGTLIIVDTSLNSIDTYLFRFSLSHVFFVLGFHDCSCCQTSRSHDLVWILETVSVVGYLDQLWTFDVDSTND